MKRAKTVKKEMNGKKKRFNRPWSDNDFAELEAAVARNAKKRDQSAVAKLAKKLRRTPGAVRQKLHAHGMRLL